MTVRQQQKIHRHTVTLVCGHSFVESMVESLTDVTCGLPVQPRVCGHPEHYPQKYAADYTHQSASGRPCPVVSGRSGRPGYVCDRPEGHGMLHHDPEGTTLHSWGEWWIQVPWGDQEEQGYKPMTGYLLLNDLFIETPPPAWDKDGVW